MSHFKVLVIGDNVEEQLEPYNENTEVTPYRVTGFNHVEELQKALDWDRNPNNNNPEGFDNPGTDLSKQLTILQDWKGDGLRINHEEGRIEEWSTYNPLSKWDFWSVGGRYNATFKIKPDADEADYVPSQPHWSEGFGNEADHENASDCALKRAIDYKAMVDSATTAAEKDWAAMAEATDGIAPPTRGWAETLDAYGRDNLDAAREEWNRHPWNVATRKARYWDAYNYFHMSEADPKAAFFDHQKKMAVAGFYAVVKDGKWSARGEMGWFGMSNDDIDHNEWLRQTAELINSLPDDTRLTVVDCHI